MIIQVSKNKIDVQIDDDDYEKIHQYKWNIRKYGRTSYAYACKNGVRILMHRLIMNAEIGQIIDHIDGNGLNNLKSNLRFCTHKENMWNSRKRKDNKSGHKGVFYNKYSKVYLVQMIINKKNTNLGYFDNYDDAVNRYVTVAKQIHGEFYKV